MTTPRVDAPSNGISQGKTRNTLVLTLLSLFALSITACGSTVSNSPASPVAARSATPTAPALTDAPLPAKGSGVVMVLYAGSLVATMENAVGPAFSKSAGYEFQGEGKGSLALANEIKDRLRQPDVFISADPTVNDTLAGANNGDLADWYVVWGQTTMVVAYNPKSRFAAQLDQARAGTKPWYELLKTPGFKLGRTDPQLDPKGYRTVFLFDLAEKYYKQPGLRQAILVSDANTDQVFPEEELVTRLQTGQLDAGIFYTSEVSEINLPFITLPDEVNQGNPKLASLYGQETYTNAKGQSFKGSPIVYTATVPSVAKNPAAGLALAQYLATAEGRSRLQEHGVLPVDLLAGGDVSKIPQQLRPFIRGAYQP